MVKPPEWRRKICAKTMWNVSIIQNYKKNRVCDNIRKTQEKKKETQTNKQKHLAVTFLC